MSVVYSTYLVDPVARDEEFLHGSNILESPSERHKTYRFEKILWSILVMVVIRNRVGQSVPGGGQQTKKI
jgi:hypothetical protein